ncbi:MAG: anaerobic ribonucleoside-triphosphate reductase [Candidatus Pacebacteria bacterium]|nr:anaerobic ribonucleoside-triphosphate reductase [Candidatus Paceibacterota bacterium]
MSAATITFAGFRKRNGIVVPFRVDKITEAIRRAAEAAARANGDKIDTTFASRITQRVLEEMDNPLCEYYVAPDENNRRIPSIEDVQDLVEIVLSEEGFSSVVAVYKRYRKQRQVARDNIHVRDGKDNENIDVTDASLLLVHSVDRNEALPWDRARIIRQLLDKTDLSTEVAVSVAKAVENQVIASEMKTLNTTLIRELVNNELMERDYQEQLQDLSLYRVSRDFVERLMFTKSTENSNIVNNNPEAVNLGLAELLLKQWGLDTIFSPEVKRAHETGALHLHDLGYPHRVYCSSHSIEYVKKYGLRDLSNLNTESKPARSASVLTGHLNTFLASMQANYAGALGIAYINIFYAPYLENMDAAGIKQVAQELIFNGSQNAFSRGGQTLFLDFNIHTGVPRYLKNVPAIGPGGHYMMRLKNGHKVELTEQLRDDTDAAGNPLVNLYYTPKTGEERLVLREIFDKEKGIAHDETIQQELDKRGERVVTYGDYEDEARRFTRALLGVWAEGDRNGRVFEFPKCDFHISDETFKDPAQHAIFVEACELASKNGSTYFIFDRDEVTLSACCRLRTTITDNRMLLHPESMRFCGFQNVTINIPQAAYRAARQGKKDLQAVCAEIDKTMELAVDAHLQKREKIAEMMSEPGRPLYQIGRKACDGRPYVELEKCTYILGLIGVNDAVKFMTGKELHEDQEAMELALRIVSHMYVKAKKLSKKHNLKLTLEESPAESAARRLAKADLVFFRKEALPTVKGEDESVVYYTNSVHLSAEAPVTLVERIREQAKFHSMIESGAITHAFVGEEKPSAESIQRLVRETFFRTQTAQLTVSPEFTYCNACQHNSRGLLESCERCGSEDVVGETRVVGYFSKIQNWNNSKRYGELVARHKGRYAVETADTQESFEQTQISDLVTA